MAQGSYILEEAQPYAKAEQRGNNKATERGRSLLLSETQEDNDYESQVNARSNCSTV